MEEENLRQFLQGGDTQEGLITWHDLCIQLADAGPKRRALSPTGSRILLRQLLKDATPSPLIASAITTSGFSEALLQLIASCKLAGVSPADLKTFGEAEGHSTLPELADLYRDYLARLNGDDPSVPFSDQNDRLRDAAIALETGAPLPDVLSKETAPFVIIQDPPELSVAQGRMLIALGERLAARGQGLILLLPDFEDRADLKQDWEERQRHALPGGKDIPLNILLYPLAGGPPTLQALIDGLFQNTPGRSRGTSPPLDPQAPPLRLLEGPTLAAEIRGVIGQVRSWLMDGTSPEAIAIACPNWSRYTVPLQRALDAAGIRWTGPAPPPLGLSPVARVGLDLCHLVRRGFPRDDLLTLLGGGEDGQLVTPNALLGERFRDGSQATLLLKRCGAQKEPRSGEDGEGYRTHLLALANHFEVQKQSSAAEDARALADACDALFARLAPLGQPAPLSVITGHLRAILGELGLLPLAEDWRALIRFRSDGEEGDNLAKEELRILARDQAAAREMLGLLDGLARTSRLLGDPLLEPGAFVQLLGQAISDDKLPVRGARGGQVILLPLSQLGGRRFNKVSILGLNEGDLPRLEQPDPLLPDSVKVRYNESELPGSFLDTAMARQQREAAQLLMGITSAQEGLILSWSLADDTGRDLLPSPWMDDIQRGAPHINIEQLPGSPIPPLGSCHTLRDLERRASLGGLAPDLRPGEHQAMEPVLRALGERQPARWQNIEVLSEVEGGRLAFFLGQVPEGSPFVGAIPPGSVLEGIRGKIPGSLERPLSPKQLEEWSTCGFKYLAGRVLRVRAIDTQGEDLDLRQAGNLIHACLQQLYQDLRKLGLLPLNALTLPAALGRIEPAMEAVGVTWKKTQPYTHSGLFELRHERMAGQLRALLRYEAKANEATPDAMPTPVYFEKPFGMKPKDGEESSSLPALGIPSLKGDRRLHLRGIIDRVDEAGAGYRVIDYKSGGSAAQEAKLKADRLLKTDLQLPIYALAIQEGLKTKEVDALYYGLRDASSPETRTLKGVFTPPNKRKKPFLSGTLDNFLELAPTKRKELIEEGHPNIANRVWEIMDGMETGRYLVKPESCKFCDFKGVCRVMNLIDAIDGES